LVLDGLDGPSVARRPYRDLTRIQTASYPIQGVTSSSCHVTGVDSLYVESIQIADLALSLYRKKELEQDPAYAPLDLGFIAARAMTEMSRGWKP
jgi:hypothetical protein